MLCCIFQHPLTKIGFLCYLVHGELLCGGLAVRTPILPQLGSLFFPYCYLCIVPQHFLLQKCFKRPFFGLELSSQVQQRIEENLKRGLPAEAFARSTVEFGNEGCYLSLAEVLHINRLGTVFTD